jgi:hypothetical protein
MRDALGSVLPKQKQLICLQLIKNFSIYYLKANPLDREQRVKTTAANRNR